MCKFCDNLNYLKKVNRNKQNHIDGKRTYYKVSLVESIHIDGYEKSKTTYRAIPIKYCPECGKKVTN